jgi:hypothetical protein
MAGPVAWLWVVLAALLAAGCSSKAGTISGTVTMDGQPLDKGTISFAAAEGAAQPVTAEIVNGSYSTKLEAGKKFVQISAPLLVGQRKQYNAPDAPTDDIWEERLPAKFHAESKLEVEVKPGSNSKNWDTQSIRGSKPK